ncbi:hypothetical protein HPP92_012972 [Vanilla planifolia]|uniref:Helicase C-terminal domain-containing protein n=1 Tax=Vanilla planifolia TaxID=51239 RepID=A0A835UYC8_VANPL|nr:hypothetical protein HPP92_012972 [Vanilla planifolia]
MIRRLKEHVLTQLPPKRRQIIMLKLKIADVSIATTLYKVNSGFSGDVKVSNQSVVDSHVDQNDIDGSEKSGCFNLRDASRGNSKLLNLQEIGIAKLSGFREWFSSHVADGELEIAHNLGIGFSSQKFIIFAHHIKVLDGIQEFVCEKGIQFVRIDGSTLPKDRKIAVESFRLSSEVRIAIIGITAGGVGLDFSSAQNVVFLELPKSASEMLQAEDRAHRRGQTNAVNIYIFCAKGTCDESHWMHLNRSLFGVSSMMNGKYDAVKEIEVNGVLQLDNPACGVGTNEVAIRAYTCKGEHRVQSITKNITLTQPLESEICIPNKESMKLDSVEKMANKEGGQQLQIITVDGTYCEVDACEEGLIKEEYLRFEVSRYTGGFICISAYPEWIYDQDHFL